MVQLILRDDLVQMVRQWKNGDFAFDAGPGKKNSARMVNQGSTDLVTGQRVTITGRMCSVTTPDVGKAVNEFLTYGVQLSGRPASGRDPVDIVAFAAEPIPSGKVGLINVPGLSAAAVKVMNTNHLFADFDDSGEVISAEDGVGRIIAFAGSFEVGNTVFCFLQSRGKRTWWDANCQQGEDCDDEDDSGPFDVLRTDVSIDGYRAIAGELDKDTNTLTIGGGDVVRFGPVSDIPTGVIVRNSLYLTPHVMAGEGIIFKDGGPCAHSMSGVGRVVLVESRGIKINNTYTHTLNVGAGIDYSSGTISWEGLTVGSEKYRSISAGTGIRFNGNAIAIDLTAYRIRFTFDEPEQGDSNVVVTNVQCVNGELVITKKKISASLVLNQ